MAGVGGREGFIFWVPNNLGSAHSLEIIISANKTIINITPPLLE